MKLIRVNVGLGESSILSDLLHTSHSQETDTDPQDRMNLSSRLISHSVERTNLLNFSFYNHIPSCQYIICSLSLFLFQFALWVSPPPHSSPMTCTRCMVGEVKHSLDPRMEHSHCCVWNQNDCTMIDGIAHLSGVCNRGI